MKDDGCDEYSSKICQTPPQIIFYPKKFGPKIFFFYQKIVGTQKYFFDQKDNFDLNYTLWSKK